MTLKATYSYIPISDHPRLIKITEEFSTFTRQNYGQEFFFPKFGDIKFKLEFSEVSLQRAKVQIRIRCADLEYELQIADPFVFADFNEFLESDIPFSIRHAAVLHILAPLFQMLEQHLKTTIELTEIKMDPPLWIEEQVIGCIITRQDSKGSRHTKALLRSDKKTGWKVIDKGPQDQNKTYPMDNFILDFSVVTNPIILTIQELKELEPGDVLVTDATIESKEHIAVRLKQRKHDISVFTALLHDTQLTITSIRKPQLISTAETKKISNFSSSNFNSNIMKIENSPITTETQELSEASIDNIEIDIDLELGRVSLPLSLLRKLTVGQIIETQKSINEESIILSCGGRRIGFGQLVAVGEKLGVRITNLDSKVNDKISAETGFQDK